MGFNRIFIKVFALCLSLIVLTIGLQLGFQYFFLDDYYEQNIITNVTGAINQLKNDLMTNDYTQNQISTKIDNLSYQQNMLLQLSSIDSKGFFEPNTMMGGSTVTVLGEQGGRYVLSIEGFPIYAEDLGIDKKIFFKGYKEDVTGLIYPYYINIDGMDYEQEYSQALSSVATNTIVDEHDNSIVANTNQLLPSSEVIEVQGLIKDFSLDEKYKNATLINGYDYQVSKLMDEMMNVLFNDQAIIQLHNQGVVNYQRLDTYTGNNNLYFMTTMKLPDDHEYLLMGITELAPIQAIANVSMEFSVMVSIIGLFVAVMVSFVFSKGLTNPIVHIGSITTKMARLDFEDKCQVKSKDEIGDLAKNINDMSKALETNINHLHIANQQLQEDIDEKERLEVFRKQFIADASHELKTPITVIKGIGEGMVDGVYHSDDQGKVRELLEQADHMQNVVYELLSVSRIESEDINARFTIFQLDEVIKSVIHRYQPFIKEKDLTIETILNESFIKGDEPLIEMVISNLLSNAIKYTPLKGKVKLLAIHEKDMLKVSIENSPASIPDEELENVWTAFYRIEKSRNRQFGGTGLGLYTVREVLRKHGIEPLIENTIAGVRISFEIPVVYEE